MIINVAELGKIVVTEDPRQIIEVEGVDALPDTEGMVLSCEVVLPAFEKGAYYRPFSGGTARGNRVDSVAFGSIIELENYTPPRTRKEHESIQQGQFILLKVADDNYLALLPMTSMEAYGQFFVENGKLLLKSGNFGTDRVQGKLPLLVWAYGNSPYEATRLVWESVLESGYVAAKPRSGKEFPEQPYGYLGWCSWEHYKTDISEGVIADAIAQLEASAAPFRWVMVDDGYMTLEDKLLVDFKPDPEKFPNGWKPIMELKKEAHVTWIGVWRTLLGYKGGLHAEHAMRELDGSLVEGREDGGGYVLPDETQKATGAFHHKMAKDATDSGFDFTKVDFQTYAFDRYRGAGNAVRASQLNNAALEDACYENGLPLMNCISQPNINSLQFSHSALTRSSPDYHQSDKDKNRCNTYQSFSNHLWLSQTVWGDLDMFHSHDGRDSRPMAIARAISGGPVYVSDEPSRIKADVLKPFVFEDGKILRTSAPATLLPESFFIHPFRDDNVFRVVAPLEDGVAAIALFNFTESGKDLESGFTAKDYTHAGELLAPGDGPWDLPEDGLLVYDRDNHSVVEFDDTFRTTVLNGDAKLFLLYPKTKGWAVIGRSDKYLPPASVKLLSASENQVSFSVEESGPLLIWSDIGAPRLAGASLEPLHEHVFLANLPVKEGVMTLTVERCA